MTTYTLRVTDMKVVPYVGDHSNVVYQVGWLYTGSNGTREVPYGGTTVLEFSPNGFVPLEQLTEEMVVGWVQSAWSDEERAAYEGAIEQGLYVAKPVQLPWAQTGAS